MLIIDRANIYDITFPIFFAFISKHAHNRFMVVDRESFAGIPISKKSETATSTTLSTAS